MPYGYLRENTASYWVNAGASTNTNYWPSDGQGANTTTAASSQLASCSASNPVIIEAIEVREQATSATSVLIQDQAGSTTLFEIKVPVSTGTQWFALGGAYGVQVNQGFCVRYANANSSGVKVYYRFAGQ